MARPTRSGWVGGVARRTTALRWLCWHSSATSERHWPTMGPMGPNPARSGRSTPFGLMRTSSQMRSSRPHREHASHRGRADRPDVGTAPIGTSAKRGSQSPERDSLSSSAPAKCRHPSVTGLRQSRGSVRTARPAGATSCQAPVDLGAHSTVGTGGVTTRACDGTVYLIGHTLTSLHLLELERKNCFSTRERMMLCLSAGSKSGHPLHSRTPSRMVRMASWF